MALYLVTQSPRPRYRNSLITSRMVVEANSAAAAIRKAVTEGEKTSENWFSPSPEYSKPTASILELNTIF